jgi:hypothetical protein
MKQITLHVPIDPGVKQMLQEQADAEGITLALLVRQIIREHNANAPNVEVKDGKIKSFRMPQPKLLKETKETKTLLKLLQRFAEQGRAPVKVKWGMNKGKGKRK